MGNYKISLIVPIYGVERYIGKFAETALGQDSDGIQFIFVNDGTKDRSVQILQELIDKIEVHAVEGTGLNRTQSVIIHYKFIGELDMPENFDKIKVNTRKGVEVEYLRTTKTA